MGDTTEVPDPHWVYIVQIDTTWGPKLSGKARAGQPCLYVGQTGIYFHDRFRQHLRGLKQNEAGEGGAAKPFVKIRECRVERGLEGQLESGKDAWLRKDMMQELGLLEPISGRKSALRIEFMVASHFREEGYLVFGPKKPPENL